MSFRLVDSRWDAEFDAASRKHYSELRIACPFIKTGAAKHLLKHGKPDVLQVITRFNLDDCCAGASDIGALEWLLESGARIRGVRNLHAKLYLFGASCVIVTSANLTEAGLGRNQEFGFIADSEEIIRRSREYFDKLWDRAGNDVSASQLADWKRQVEEYLAAGAPPARPRLGDKGVRVTDWTASVSSTTWVGETGQAFVKFFGESDNRKDRSYPVLEELKRAGCHWACAYPKEKRPRSVRDGALMFMGRLVRNPNDILIFGRAVGMKYKEGRDDASQADLKVRPRRKDWPHYVRVHHAEFVDGTLSNGVSLNELMEGLGSDSFASTQRHAAKGKGNTDPRHAYRQQAAVELSPQGLAWLNERLERAFDKYGKLPPATLARLDWPVKPLKAGGSHG